VGHAPVPADVLSCDLAETISQRGLLNIDDLTDMAPAAGVLGHYAADPPLGCPVTLLQDCDGPPATLRLRSFPRQDPTATLGLRLEHRLTELCLRQRPYELDVFFLKLAQPFGLFCLHSAVELSPAVVGGLEELENSAGGPQLSGPGPATGQPS